MTVPPPDESWESSVLVESPLQLLCAIEAHAGGLLGSSTRLFVRDDVPGLAEALEALRALELPPGLSARITPPRLLTALGSRICATGDVCSGLFQAFTLIPGKVPRLTVLDDGLATLDTIDRLTDDSAPLLRPGATSTPPRRLLGRAAGRKLRRLARTGRLRVFTALRLSDDARTRLRDLGAPVVPNTFEWLRSRPEAETITEPTVVVGSGLVADGLIEPDEYVDWVRGLGGSEPVLYIPHRRSRRDVLDRLALSPRIRIAPPGAPVEVRLRGLTAGQQVICLPTTAALLLTPLLEPRGVPVTVHDLPEAWWTSRADPALRTHLRSVVRLLHHDQEATA